jgi:hypothetical protein
MLVVLCKGAGIRHDCLGCNTLESLQHQLQIQTAMIAGVLDLMLSPCHLIGIAGACDRKRCRLRKRTRVSWSLNL